MASITRNLDGFIEVDDAPQPLENDDGYSTGLESDTTSVTSNIRRHVKENGRTYHRYKEGKYLCPNDEAELDRLDFYHAVQLAILNDRLFLAPIGDNPKRILDCGTGTGIWALDMADKFPSAVVTGVDLSAIQPEWISPNVKFEIDDLDQEWSFKEDYFDFIHARQMFTGIRNHPDFLKQVYKHAKPGGYFEFAESGFLLHSDDGTLTTETKIGYMFERFREYAEKAGVNLPEPEEVSEMATNAGFVDVNIVKMKQLWGAWPKDQRLKQVGRMCAAVGDQHGIEAFCLALFTRFGGMTEEEGKRICAEASREIQATTHVHAYNELWHVYGRKPEKQ